MGKKGRDQVKMSVCLNEDAVIKKSESKKARSFFDKSTRLARQCAHGFDTSGQGGYGVFDVGFVFDDGHAVKAAFFEAGDKGREVECAFADDGVVPLAVGVKDEVFVVDAIDLSGEVFCPFDGVALAGTDLQCPGCVDAQANFGRAEANEVLEYAGLSAKVISAVTVYAYAYAVFSTPCAYLCDGFGIGFELEMAGDVFGAGNGGAFKEGFFSGIASEGLYADGDDGYTCVVVGFDDVFPCVGVLEVGVGSTDFDFVETDVFYFLGDVGVVFEVAKTKTLDSVIQCCTHVKLLVLGCV